MYFLVESFAFRNLIRGRSLKSLGRRASIVNSRCLCEWLVLENALGDAHCAPDIVLFCQQVRGASRDLGVSSSSRYPGTCPHGGRGEALLYAHWPLGPLANCGAAFLQSCWEWGGDLPFPSSVRQPSPPHPICIRLSLWHWDPLLLPSLRDSYSELRMKDNQSQNSCFSKRALSSPTFFPL